MCKEVQGVAKKRLRLLHVNYVDADTSAKQKRHHVWVTDSDLVTKMNTIVEQISYSYKVTDTEEIMTFQWIYICHTKHTFTFNIKITM